MSVGPAIGFLPHSQGDFLWTLAYWRFYFGRSAPRIDAKTKSDGVVQCFGSGGVGIEPGYLGLSFVCLCLIQNCQMQ